MTEDSPKNIFHFKDHRFPPDPVHDYSGSLLNDHQPLVIDNGSYHCRVGWATDSKPRMVFKNLTARSRHKKDVDVTLIGNDISNLELMKWQLKSQFDRNLITQYDVQEQIMDYLFYHMGISTEGKVDHPIVMTEAACNPNYCRQQMSELLFECYHVQSVAFGVDSLFSLYNSHPTPEKANSLVISCGYTTTHILPVLGGRVQPQMARRINVGGSQVDSFMQRILQLKYPGHFPHITLARAEELVQQHTYMATDYCEELQGWLLDDYYDQHVHKMQLPYTQPQVVQTQTAEQQRERREQQIKRLKEYAARRREEKLVSDQARLDELISIQEQLEEDEDIVQKVLQENGYNSRMELQSALNDLRLSIHKTQQKIQMAAVVDQADNLLDIPDEQLTAAQREVKRKKQLLKVSAKKAKGRKTATNIPQDDPDQDLESWLGDVRRQRQDLLEKREQRKQKKAEMSKRRSQANQQRMKIITQLAQGTKRKKEDTFGQNEDDWNVYKQISRDGGESDSEAEREKLEEVESILREHDPEFQRQCNPQALPANYDIAEYYRMHVGIERIRVPELLFQPSMVGLEQAGIAETIDFMLKKYPAAVQNKLIQNVFLTGGCASFPRFRDRLEKELLAMRPFQSSFQVTTAADPALGAWYGARKWSQSPALKVYSVTRSEYDEKGGEYLKEHSASNHYYPTPLQPVAPAIS